MEARHRILNRGKMTEKPVERSPVTWSNERERRFRRETLRLLRWDATRHDTTLSSSSSRQIPRINRGAHAIFNTWNFFSTFTTLLFFLFPSFPCYFSFFFRFVSFFFFCFFFPFERERERKVINTSRNTIREVRLEYETCFTKQNRRVDHERI